MSTLSREKAEKARRAGAKKRVRENRARGKARGRGGRAMRGSGADRIRPFGVKVRQGACAADGAGIAIAERRSRLNFEAA